MPLTTTTPYGPAALEQLSRVVRNAQAADRLAPVTVIVASNHVGVATRRALARALGGLAAVGFLTPYRLAELIGASRLAAAGRRPVSTPVVAAAVRAVLADAPGIFGALATHAATESALVAAYRELRDLTPEELAALAVASAKAAEVVRVHDAVRSRLERAWYDEQDLLASAGAVVTEGGGRGLATFGLGTVAVYLPQALTPATGRFLARVLGRAPGHVVVGMTGDAEADAEVRLALTRLGAQSRDDRGSDGDRDGGDASGVLDGLVSPTRTRVLSTSDADDEVRHAVRRVVDAAAAGVPLHRIAVLHASPDPYGRLLHEHLATAGVAVNGSAVVPLAERVAARALLHLLALPAGGFRREELFAWLSAAPVLVQGRWAPISAWERLSRDAGVVEGRRQWDERLAHLADEREQRAVEADADPEAPQWRADRAREDAARARRLRSFVCGVIDDLADAAEGSRSWGAHARWAESRLRALLGSAERREQDRWPSVECEAAQQVERALARLGALDAVEGPVELAVFTRTLAHELEGDLGRVGRLGEGVLVGSVAMGVGLDLDLVIVLGLAEGTFPRPVRDDSLLPDDDRRACGGALPLRHDRIGREHRQLVAALAGARHQLLSFPRGDLRRSSARVPSRWLLDVAGALAGRPLPSTELSAVTAPWFHHVASFDAGLRAMPRPATATEHRLRALVSDGELDDAGLTAGMAAIEARSSAGFTRFDGNLAGVAVPSPVDDLVSPTRLEAWAHCPSAYLLGTVLGAKPVENPEDELELTPLDRGNLVHLVLERFLGEVLARGDAGVPAPHEPWTDGDRVRILELAAAVFDEYERRGLTGLPIFWKRDRRELEAQFRRILEEDARHRAATSTRPVAAEVAFGLDGHPPATILLDDGRHLRFRGRADRVDVDVEGRAHVVDYKTGARPKELAGLRDDPVLHGTKLQLPVYAVAARQRVGSAAAGVRSEYWFCSDKGGWDRCGYDVDDDVLDRAGATLSRIVRGIESGLFPPHPAASTTNPWISCHHCDPDGLGEADLRRAWERKRHDPLLAVYAELVEPLDRRADDGDGDDGDADA